MGPIVLSPTTHAAPPAYVRTLIGYAFVGGGVSL